MKNITSLLISLLFVCRALFAHEYHVSIDGNDFAAGSTDAPFRTIAHAATIAQPGDTVTVHEGTYRERVNPINGGLDHVQRILYRAAPGERVVIKGSEIIKGWKTHKSSVWKVVIPNTFFGDYNPYQDALQGDWLHDKGTNHHTGEVFLNGKSLFEKNTVEEVLAAEPYPDARDQEASTYTWHAKVDETNTTIWANFQGADPNEELVEINVRGACFYPEKPGVNYITVRGFIMDQAATQWAAPTAEQVGLLGTHWSKGWIIEGNVISNSKSVGITLGKERSTGHNVWSKNPEKDGATHYNEVIFKAYHIGWSKDNIGSHIVRNNEVFHCGQAGIVGSLGAVFSQITNNHIHDIWTKRIFGGYEMAGIKIHAPIDMTISGNRIHNAGRGMWLDWMTQGTRVTGNLFYDNTNNDLFIEVSHGPYLVDNNIFLSDVTIQDWSEGGAFVHNLIAGAIQVRKIANRSTPYHFPHSTKILGVKNIDGGDNRYYNNIFIKRGAVQDTVGNERANFFGLHGYRVAKLPTTDEGNVFYNGAKPLENATNAHAPSNFMPICEIEEKGKDVYLKLRLDSTPLNMPNRIITSTQLGKTFISEAFHENPDGSSYLLHHDYFNQMRNESNPLPGPFEKLNEGEHRLKVW